MRISKLTAAVFAFQTPLVFRGWLDDQQLRWSFRTAWIISDIRPAYGWLNDARPRTNHPLVWRSDQLLHHFKLRLQSRNEQVFAIDREGAPVVIFEILPVGRTDIPLHAPLRVEGWVIYYILPASQHWDTYWCAYALEILQTVRRAQTVTVFNIEIPSQATELKSIATEFGFVQIGSYVNSRGAVELYQG